MWPGKWCYQSKYRNNGIVHWLCSNLFWQHHLQTGLENSFWRRQYYTSHITLGKRRWRTLDCQKLLWPDNIKKKIKLFKGHTNQITLCKNCIITTLHFCIISRNSTYLLQARKGWLAIFLDFLSTCRTYQIQYYSGSFRILLSYCLVARDWKSTKGIQKSILSLWIQVLLLKTSAENVPL